MADTVTRSGLLLIASCWLFLHSSLAATAADEPQAAGKQEPAGKPEAADKKLVPIGYPTVVEALLAAQKGMDAKSRMERGWTIVETREQGIPVHWFFTHSGHPAHPAAIKRVMNSKGGTWNIDMTVLCEGPKSECDKLTEEFRRINEKLEKAWRSR